jgi:hypothetical protein
MADGSDRGSAAATEEDVSVGELIRDALGDTRELVRLEVALAREDLRTDVAAARSSAIAAVAAGVTFVASIALFVVAIVLALEVGWLGAVVAGAILLAIAVTLGLIAWRAIPLRPFDETRGRLRADVAQLRERIA